MSLSLESGVRLVVWRYVEGALVHQRQLFGLQDGLAVFVITGGAPSKAWHSSKPPRKGDNPDFVIPSC